MTSLRNLASAAFELCRSDSQADVRHTIAELRALFLEADNNATAQAAQTVVGDPGFAKLLATAWMLTSGNGMATETPQRGNHVPELKQLRRNRLLDRKATTSACHDALDRLRRSTKSSPLLDISQAADRDLGIADSNASHVFLCNVTVNGVRVSRPMVTQTQLLARTPRTRLPRSTSTCPGRPAFSVRRLQVTEARRRSLRSALERRTNVQQLRPNRNNLHSEVIDLICVTFPVFSPELF